MAEIKFVIQENIGVLSESAIGWRKELNLVSWNDREPKYDLREGMGYQSQENGQGYYTDHR